MGIYTKSNEVLPFPIPTFLPPQAGPDAVSQTIPQPAIHFFKFTLHVGQPEIIDPAALNRFDFLYPFIESHGSGFPGFLL
jgi:hypothetical protein